MNDNENPIVSQWTWNSAIEKAHQRMADKGLSKLKTPSHPFRDLGSIENIESVNDDELANMLTRHLAWYSYATVELAYAKAAYNSLDEIFEAKLGEEMNRIARTQDSRLVKDILRGIAIQKSEDIKPFFRKRIELQQEMQLLEGTVKGLEIRARGVEAEAIRRASARKMER